MDAFEQRFAATLQEIARRAPEDPVSAPATPEPRSSAGHRLVAPLLAAAAVTTILGVGAWQGGLGGSEAGEDQLAPAGPGGTSSQTADAPLVSRHAVIDVAEQLTAFSDRPGFGKVGVDYETSTITVFWAGTPPTEVSSLAGERPSGVMVLLESATFSETELLDAGEAVMQAGRERFGQDAIAEVHANDDLSGLVVDATTERVTAEALADATRGIPLTVRIVDIAEVTCAYGQDCRVQNAD